MGCEHLEEYYELYLVGAISDGACADIHEHFESGCPYCLEHLREAALSIYLMSLTAKPVRPDPKTKSQILKRLRKR